MGTEIYLSMMTNLELAFTVSVSDGTPEMRQYLHTHTHTQCQGVLNPGIHRCLKCAVGYAMVL